MQDSVRGPVVGVRTERDCMPMQMTVHVVVCTHADEYMGVGGPMWMSVCACVDEHICVGVHVWVGGGGVYTHVQCVCI